MEFVCEKCGGPRSKYSASMCRACYEATRVPAKVKRAPRVPIDPASIAIGDAYRAFTGDIFHVIGITDVDLLILQIDTTRDERDIDICERTEFAQLMKEKVPGRPQRIEPTLDSLERSELVWC